MLTLKESFENTNFDNLESILLFLEYWKSYAVIYSGMGNGESHYEIADDRDYVAFSLTAKQGIILDCSYFKPGFYSSLQTNNNQILYEYLKLIMI